jgi:hypothetical protein
MGPITVGRGTSRPRATGVPPQVMVLLPATAEPVAGLAVNAVPAAAVPVDARTIAAPAATMTRLSRRARRTGLPGPPLACLFIWLTHYAVMNSCSHVL